MNKVGKKIRFRRKKRDKQKTENRARKALKTISLILGNIYRLINIFYREVGDIRLFIG